MITFIDLGPKATVHLFLTVPVPLAHGGWTWGELAEFPGVLAREFAYTAEECRDLVHAYGRHMGERLQKRDANRFTLCARGPITGMVLGHREWQWDAAARAFRAVGEYLCGWRPAVKALYLQTGYLMSGQRFNARLSPIGQWCPEPDRLAPAA